jgi:hypothetical protein
MASFLESLRCLCSYSLRFFFRAYNNATVGRIPDLDRPNCLVIEANLMLVADWTILTAFEAGKHLFVCVTDWVIYSCIGIVILMMITGYRACV